MERINFSLTVLAFSIGCAGVSVSVWKVQSRDDEASTATAYEYGKCDGLAESSAMLEHRVGALENQLDGFALALGRLESAANARDVRIDDTAGALDIGVRPRIARRKRAK